MMTWNFTLIGKLGIGRGNFVIFSLVAIGVVYHCIKAQTCVNRNAKYPMLSNCKLFSQVRTLLLINKSPGFTYLNASNVLSYGYLGDLYNDNHYVETTGMRSTLGMNRGRFGQKAG